MTTLVKDYIYQVYDSTNTYIANLPNVISEFHYKNNINSGGAELEIEIQNTLDDVGAVQTDEFWITETGDKIVDESGNHIVFSAQFDFNNIPIAPGYRVKVFTSYSENPSGVQVFDGVISEWSTDYGEDTIVLRVLSWGVQLDNYLVISDPSGLTIDQQVYDKEYNVIPWLGGTAGVPIAQSFNIPSDVVVGSFSVFVRASNGPVVINWKTNETVTPVCLLFWELYDGTPDAPGSLVESGQTQFFATDTTVRQTILQLSQPRTLNGDYFFAFRSGNAGTWYYTNPVMQATSTNPYAGGSVYTGVQNNNGTTWTPVAADDLAFTVQASTGETTISFVDTDPGSILKRIIDQLIAQGGLVAYTEDSVDLASTLISYDYKLQTVLEGVQKIIQLSPDGFYWYIDVGSNTIHYHRTSNSADHTLVLGQHLSRLQIRQSLEQMVNAVHFSGGDTGSGENLYISQKDAASVLKYGQWLSRISDNRVTDETVAGVIVSGEIGKASSPIFYTTTEVLAATYDIETFYPGNMINLRGFNNLIDTLLFQVAAIERFPDRVILSLGSLLPRQSSELDNVKRRLTQLESLDNPASPS